MDEKIIRTILLKRTAENEAITFNGISFSSSKQLAAKFYKQLNTSKLGRHSSSRETRLETRETKRKQLEMAETFTAGIVTRAIKLSIFHLKNLGARAIEYITALFNLPVTNCQIPAIWKSLLIIHKLSLAKTPPKDLHIGLSRFFAQTRKSWKL